MLMSHLTGWLEGIHAEEASQLPDMVIAVVVRWALGLPLPAGLAGGRCTCGQRVPDRTGWHEAHCRNGGGWQMHHDIIVAGVRRW